jgi:membrane-associated phospholipid phosphatase
VAHGFTEQPGRLLRRIAGKRALEVPPGHEQREHTRDRGGDQVDGEGHDGTILTGIALTFPKSVKRETVFFVPPSVTTPAPLGRTYEEPARSKGRQALSAVPVLDREVGLLGGRLAYLPEADERFPSTSPVCPSPERRLLHLPVDASYPSGHTAASIAVYGALALIATSRFTHRPARVFIWAAAVLILAYVAFSRMYRGMHHPIDIAGGVVVGVAVLTAVQGEDRRRRRSLVPR